MKKLAVAIISVILISCFSSALFASGMNSTATLTLRAYIAPKTTVSADEFGFTITSNTNNFSYSITEDGANRTLNLVAL